MPEFTERHLEMIEDTNKTVNTIKTVLLGANGDEGLVGKVTEICKNHEELEKDHETLKRNFWILVAFLIGSGAIAGSVLTALK